jgi:hypothetical protein
MHRNLHKTTASDRLTLIDMAQAWRALAKQAEKNPELYRLELQSIAHDE